MGSPDEFIQRRACVCERECMNVCFLACGSIMYVLSMCWKGRKTKRISNSPLWLQCISVCQAKGMSVKVVLTLYLEGFAHVSATAQTPPKTHEHISTGGHKVFIGHMR